MDLGKTIALFLIIAAVLIMMFCLILRYFSRKLRKQRSQALDITQMQQALSEELVQGAYEQFQCRRKMAQQIEMKHMSIQSNNIIQTSQLKQALDISNNIYGMSKLRQRLDSDIIPLQVQTNRSCASLKSFNISRLNTAQSQQVQLYHYIQRLVSYNFAGLNIIEVNSKAIIKRVDGECELAKDIETKDISYQSQNFVDQVELNGFQINKLGCFKYVNSIDVSHMKTQKTYEIKYLKTSVSKDPIDQQQFDRQKQMLLKQSK